MQKSILSYDTQKEVDRAIHEHGVGGIGYYIVRTYCTNCDARGSTLFKHENEVVLGQNVSCWKCHCQSVVMIRGSCVSGSRRLTRR